MALFSYYVREARYIWLITFKIIGFFSWSGTEQQQQAAHGGGNGKRDRKLVGEVEGKG